MKFQCNKLTKKPRNLFKFPAGPNPIGLGGESFAVPPVIMKGGGAGLVYLDDLDGILHGSGYKTPIDPVEGVNYKTQAVEFCFAYQPAAPKGESMFRDGDEGTFKFLRMPLLFHVIIVECT